MYRLWSVVDLDDLRKYGFKKGYEYPDNERCICNDPEREDFWLIPLHPDNPNEIYYADDDYDQPIWSIHVMEDGKLWIDCVPSCTYHISNWDMEQMFYVLLQMIQDGLIYDDYKMKLEKEPEQHER